MGLWEILGAGESWVGLDQTKRLADMPKENKVWHSNDDVIAQMHEI